jgi:hypothetical protein
MRRYCLMLCERQGITACGCLVGSGGGGGLSLLAIIVGAPVPVSKALPTATIYSDTPLLTPPRGRDGGTNFRRLPRLVAPWGGKERVGGK